VVPKAEKQVRGGNGKRGQTRMKTGVEGKKLWVQPAMARGNVTGNAWRQSLIKGQTGKVGQGNGTRGEGSCQYHPKKDKDPPAAPQAEGCGEKHEGTKCPESSKRSQDIWPRMRRGDLTTVLSQPPERRVGELKTRIGRVVCGPTE